MRGGAHASGNRGAGGSAERAARPCVERALSLMEELVECKVAPPTASIEAISIAASAVAADDDAMMARLRALNAADRWHRAESAGSNWTDEDVITFILTSRANEPTRENGTPIGRKQCLAKARRAGLEGVSAREFKQLWARAVVRHAEMEGVSAKEVTQLWGHRTHHYLAEGAS